MLCLTKKSMRLEDKIAQEKVEFKSILKKTYNEDNKIQNYSNQFINHNKSVRNLDFSLNSRNAFTCFIDKSL